MFFWLLALNLGESNYKFFLLVINSFAGNYSAISCTEASSGESLSDFGPAPLSFPHTG